MFIPQSLCINMQWGCFLVALMVNFLVNRELHNYGTRSCVLFNKPTPRTNCFKNSMLFRGPNVWNNLTTCLRNMPSLNMFKKNVKLKFAVVS